MEPDLTKLTRYSLFDRKSKFDASCCSGRFSKEGGLKGFFETIPRVLGGEDFFLLTEAWRKAVREGNKVIVGMGAHVIKVGLAPLVIQLMEEGFINHLAVTGAFLVHDVELAMAGYTSEDVAEKIRDGSFGMALETATFINGAIGEGVRKGNGLADSVADRIVKESLPREKESVFAAATRNDVSLSAHVALGTDITHMHPEADGAAIGKGSLADFRLFTDGVMKMEGGVYLNVGSAVILPEVFLKAVSIARNLGTPLESITTGAIDFTRHYRVMENVVRRPLLGEKKGFYLLGHHEIMIPLLTAALLGLEDERG